MSDVLTLEEACEILRVSKDTIEGWRTRRIGPPFFKYTQARTSPLFILRRDLEQWIEDQKTIHTAGN